jgi:hypothetical protein
MRLGYELARLLDGALDAARTHEEERACRLMWEVLQRASTLPPDAVMEGPDELPASFYLNSARAFLNIHHYSVIE